MSLVIIKPDAVKNRQVGKILSRFERKGYDIEYMKILQPHQQLVEDHYAEHKGKDFCASLCKSFHFEKVVVLWVTHKDLTQEQTVTSIRKLVGAIDQPGTIRGDFAKSFQANSIHASDSDKSANREYILWFKRSYDDDLVCV